MRSLARTEALATESELRMSVGKQLKRAVRVTARLDAVITTPTAAPSRSVAVSRQDESSAISYQNKQRPGAAAVDVAGTTRKDHRERQMWHRYASTQADVRQQRTTDREAPAAPHSDER